MTPYEREQITRQMEFELELMESAKMSDEQKAKEALP